MSIAVVLPMALTAIFGPVGTAGAATISWTPAGFSDVAQIDTSGNLLAAYNFGSANDITVNGVVFGSENDGALDDDRFKYRNQGTYLNFTDANMYTGNSVTGLTDGDRDDLLDNMSYESGASSGYLMTLKNLTVGYDYVVQALLVDDRAGLETRSMHFSPDETVWGPSYDYSSRTDNLALLMTGTFTADGTTQQFREGFAGVGDPQFQALQIRAIPEPSTLLLAACGLLSLGFTRRRWRG